MTKIRRCGLLVSLLAALPCTAAEVNLTIFHTNDLHQSLGNLPRLAGEVAAWRAGHPATLFLDAGDWFDRGSPLPTVDRGETLIGAMARMGYDAVTVGNHDWAYGKERLYEFAETSGLRFVCADLGTNAERLPRGMSATWLTEVGGVKVGLFGLTLDGPVASPKNRDILFRSKTGLDAARDAVAELRGQGAELVIALTHMGLEPMTHESPDKLTDVVIAKSVPGIDVIVGGHTHTNLKPELTDSLLAETGVVIVQSGALAQYLGRLDLTWDTTAHKLVRHRAENLRPAADWPAQPEVADWLAERYRLLMPDADRVVGAVSERIERYNLGAWYADFLRARTGADVALVYRKCLYDEPAHYGPTASLTMEQLGAWIHDARVMTWKIPRQALLAYLLSDPIRDRLNPLHDKGRPFTGDGIYYSGLTATWDPATGQVASELPAKDTLTVVTPWPFTEWYEVRTKGWPTDDVIAQRPVLGGLPADDVRVLPDGVWAMLAKAAAEQPLSFSRRWTEPDPLWQAWYDRTVKPAGGP